MRRNNSGWAASLRQSGVSRRAFLRLASALITVQWANSAFASEQHTAAAPSQSPPLEEAYPFILKAPPFTRNGAHVPLVVEMGHPMEPDHYIRSLQILNETDPIPSKGIFHLSPANGRAYLSVQARMNSGSSTILAVAECTRHGRQTTSQSITIPEGEGGCATASDGDDLPASGEVIRPPVIRIPELIEPGTIRQGDIIRVQINVRHPSRTGLTHQGAQFLQTVDPLYLTEMKVLYGNRLISRYEMTPAISDNPFITFTVRATEESTIRIVLANSRGQQFQAVQQIVLT